MVRGRRTRAVAQAAAVLEGGRCASSREALGGSSRRHLHGRLPAPSRPSLARWVSGSAMRWTTPRPTMPVVPALRQTLAAEREA